MAKKKAASYMTPGEQIAGVILLTVYLVVLPFVTDPLFRFVGGLLDVTISATVQNMIYYYVLFAVTLIIFHKFIGRTSRNFADNLGVACRSMLVGTSEDGRAFYRRLGFRDEFVRRNFFIDHYERPIYENGRQCVDMYCLRMPLE